MAHESFELECRRPTAFQQGYRLFRREPEASHTGIDLEVNGKGWGAPGGQPNQACDAIRGREDRREVVFQKRCKAVGEPAAHDQSRRRDTGLPELDPLGNRGDPQTARAARQEWLGDAHGAMSVGVGFDDGEDDAGSDTTRNLLKVLTEGGKRNLSDSEAQISGTSASLFFRRSWTFAI